MQVEFKAQILDLKHRLCKDGSLVSRIVLESNNISVDNKNILNTLQDTDINISRDLDINISIKDNIKNNTNNNTNSKFINDDND